MKTNDHTVQFAGGTLGRHRHICAFFNSIDEQHRVLRSFIKEGFDRGEKALHFVDPKLREEQKHFRNGCNITSPSSARFRERKSFPTLAAAWGHAAVLSFPSVSMLRAVWLLRGVIAPTFPPRLTNCCFPWLRITPRQHFRAHASSTSA